MPKKTRPRELHNGNFHLVFAVPNQQWWICYGSGGPSNWSILFRERSYSEAKREWDRIMK